MKTTNAKKQTNESHSDASRQLREERRYGFYERAATAGHNLAAVIDGNSSRPVNRADYFRLFD